MTAFWSIVGVIYLLCGLLGLPWVVYELCHPSVEEHRMNVIEMRAKDRRRA